MEREDPDSSWSDIVIPDELEIRVREDDDYRTCSTCGGDCLPEPVGADQIGARIAFICPLHGRHRIIAPFEHLR